MGKVKVGVIGCGSIGVYHIASYKKVPNVEVAAICDIDEPTLRKAKEDFGVENAYKDYRDLLSRKEVDAVSVCLPNRLHSIVSVAAFEAGKHVLCEKPTAINAKEAQRMIDASKKAGKKLLIGLTFRFQNRSRVLKEHVEAGELGSVYYSKCGCLRRSGIPGMGSWFTTKSEAGAGPLYDIGVHALDLTLWLMGNFKPRSVLGSMYTKFGHLGKGMGDWGKPVKGGPFDVEDLAAAFVKMRDGATVFLEVSWAAHIGEERFYSTLLGDKAGADYESMTIFSEEKGNPVNKKLLYRDNDGYLTEVEHFIDCVTKDEEPVTKAEQILAVQKILDAAMESAEKGREVSIE
ncbi:MAG: Gfo/Idh/MocA family oxidoreductase [Candidatus Brockarchaeota archaeon]|nr:Gfo/Idh/MocA family oxidoreductase [Candidatus Brockarchaeota archaeon]